MSGEEWEAVRNQVEEIAAEVAGLSLSTNVIYSLHQRGLLTEADMDRLMNLTWKMEQVRQLVALLAAGDSGSSGSRLSIFLEVLQEQGLGHLVRQLDPTNAHSMDTSRQDPSASAAVRLTPYHPLLPSGHDDLTIPPLPCPPQHPTLPQPGQDVTNNNTSDNSCTDNINANVHMEIPTGATQSVAPPQRPLKISVVPSREIGGRNFKESEVYKNESDPRGYVFMANYKDFVGDQHECRRGSEIDVKNLLQLFSQMGYKTSYHINMTKWGTIQALREFRNKKEHAEVDSCIVVFMSHGRDDTSFFTSDDQCLTVHDVVERFNNRECPLLKGKPKIFIFQFCRGTGPDVGVDAVPVNVNNVRGLAVETDSSSFGETLVERDPTFTDMYIVYSTVGGFVSFRHPENGSWLVEAICEVFMKDACDTELEHLMKKVSRRVRENFSVEGNKQACEFVQRAFDRHFFFNPKPLASLSFHNCRQQFEVLPRLSAVRHHRRIRTSSPSASHKSENVGGARSRHFSGESISSEKCFDNVDVIDHSQAYALHPRIKNLTVSQRRLSAPESSSQAYGISLCHSLSKPNSEGSSPEPSESSDPGAVNWASMERLSLLENHQHQQYGNANLPSGGARGRGYGELHPDPVMEEASPLECPEEGFPLKHSQSALEAIQASEFGGITGAGPEMRGAEEARLSYKRQLSVPSNNEALQKVNDVRHYLMLNDSDEALLKPLKRIESFINKKKTEGKRRKKGEPNSLDY